jgi:hypothetical protein
MGGKFPEFPNAESTTGAGPPAAEGLFDNLSLKERRDLITYLMNPYQIGK